MRRASIIVITVGLLCSVGVRAIPQRRVAVVVAPMDGFDAQLSAALKKQGLITSLRAEPSRYAVVSTEYSWRAWLSSGVVGCDQDVCAIVSGGVIKHVATLMLVDRQASKVVWACQLPRLDTLWGDAAAPISAHCASEIRRFIEKAG